METETKRQNVSKPTAVCTVVLMGVNPGGDGGRVPPPNFWSEGTNI